jgi:hypothetical protein
MPVEDRARHLGADLVGGSAGGTSLPVQHEDGCGRCGGGHLQDEGCDEHHEDGWDERSTGTQTLTSDGCA